MTRYTLCLIALLFGLATTAGAQSIKLLEQIEDNNRTLQMIAPIVLDARIIKSLPDARIWYHVRDADQAGQTAALTDKLTDKITVDGAARGLEIRPVQMVDFGPSEGQIRYFKAADQATAEEIAKLAAEAGFDLTPVSLVEKFADSSWIETGHLEIWLPAD